MCFTLRLDNIFGVNLVTWSLGHLDTQSLSHMITIFNITTNGLMDTHTTLEPTGLLQRQKYGVRATKQRPNGQGVFHFGTIHILATT